MTQLERLRIRIGGADPMALVGVGDDLLGELLESAKAVILEKRYQLRDDYPDELPARYNDLQLRIAVVMFNQQGSEGQSAHTEPNASRTWVGLDSLLSEVRPLAKVF